MESRNVVLLDECCNVVGIAEKYASHNSNTPLHKGFSLFLFDKKTKKFILQKRNSNKKVWGGFWSNSVCGHPQFDESSSDAVRRCANFELGITVIENLEYIFSHKYSCSHKEIMEHEICDVFVGICYAPDIVPNKDEVEDIMLIAWDGFMEEYERINVPFWCSKAANYMNKDENFKTYLAKLLNEPYLNNMP